MFQLYRRSFAGLSREIWLLSLVTFINRSGTMVIPFMTVYLTAGLGFTATRAGLVMSAFGLGSILGSILGGRATDRFGFYRVQFWTLLLSGAMFMALTPVRGFWPLCGAIFILSTIAEAFRPATHVAISAYSKPENLTRSYSLLRLAINLGFSFGPAVGGLLAHRYGFHALFWVDGITCMAAALLLQVWLPERKQRNSEAAPAAESQRPVRSAYRDPSFLWFFGFRILAAMAFIQLFYAVPVFYKEGYSMTEDQIGFFLGANGLLIAILEMPLVYKVEQVIRPLRSVSIGIFLMGLSYLAFNVFSPWWLAASLAVVLITVGEMMDLPFASSWAVSRSDPHNRGQYMGLYTLSFSIAQVVGPSIGLGIAENYTFATLWYITFTWCIVSMLGLGWLDRREAARPQPVAASGV